MRDLRSGLAYLITSDIGCVEVHRARHEGTPIPNADYCETAFVVPSERDLLLGELRPLDPSRRPQPQLERFLYFQRYSTPAWHAGLIDDSADSDVDIGDEPRQWLARWKRRLYFHGLESMQLGGIDASANETLLAWRDLLPYRYADLFLAALSDGEQRSALLPRLARGISRSDGLSGPALNGELSLKIAHSDTDRLTILKQFPLTQLRLSVPNPAASELIEALPTVLLLEHQPSDARLVIALDLFELLLRLADGLEPTSPELQPLLEELAPFKGAVQMTESTDLLLIEGGRRTYWLTQEEHAVKLRDGARRMRGERQ